MHTLLIENLGVQTMTQKTAMQVPTHLVVNMRERYQVEFNSTSTIARDQLAALVYKKRRAFHNWEQDQKMDLALFELIHFKLNWKLPKI